MYLRGGNEMKKSSSRIVVLYTSADIEQDRKARHLEYLDGFEAITNILNDSELNFRFYALETYLKSGSIIDNLELEGTNVIKLYSRRHKSSYRNKGANLIRALHWFFQQNLVNDNDLILLMTGRYQIISKHFLIELKDDINFMGKLMENGSQVHTGFFVMRAIDLMKFVDSCNPRIMEKKGINIETHLRNYLLNNQVTSKYLLNLDVIAPIFGIGERNIIKL
jgi:hypothetical protein